MSDDSLFDLSTDLVRVSETVVKRSRGAGAKVINAMTKDARKLAFKTWKPYGHGRKGSAGTIRGRMGTNKARVEGYVFADGAAAYQEYGTSQHPPQPVLGPTADKYRDAWAEAILDAGSDLW